MSKTQQIVFPVVSLLYLGCKRERVSNIHCLCFSLVIQSRKQQGRCESEYLVGNKTRFSYFDNVFRKCTAGLVLLLSLVVFQIRATALFHKC